MGKQTKYKKSKQEKLQKLLNTILLLMVICSLGIIMWEVIYAKLDSEIIDALDKTYIVMWAILTIEHIIRLVRLKSRNALKDYLKFNKSELAYLVLSIILIPLGIISVAFRFGRWIIILKMPSVIKRFNDEKTFQVIADIIAIVLILFFLIPFLNVIAVSLSGAGEIVNIIPKNIDLYALKYVIHDQTFLRSFINSIFITVVGTAISIITLTMAAYPLSKPDMPLRKTVMIFFIIMMLFSGGMAAHILVVNALGLTDTIWALIFPSVINVYYLLLIKGFFESIPIELEESAKLDGANNFVVLWKIFIPMSAPMIATVAFFTAISYWNNINNSILYITTNQKIYPVPMYIKNFLGRNPMDVAQQMPELLPYWDNIKMSYILLSIIPIACAYPFIFKYLRNDISAGAVKG